MAARCSQNTLHRKTHHSFKGGGLEVKNRRLKGQPPKMAAREASLPLREGFLQVRIFLGVLVDLFSVSLRNDPSFSTRFCSEGQVEADCPLGGLNYLLTAARSCDNVS